MGKAEENKLIKKEALLNSAFNLFTTKGLTNTSISDIIQQAGVAKGTFYLYFKDKYDINNKLVMHRATQLFQSSLDKLKEQNLPEFRDRMLFVINDIIDSLAQNKVLLKFISKNLGLGVFRYAIEQNALSDSDEIKEVYDDILKNTGDNIKDTRLMLYMIIELTGSSIYSAILYEKPVSIEELKPHLYKTINSIIDQFTKI